jgi:hypothetical protein
MWTIICVFLAFLLYVAYNSAAIKLFGVPESLSNTFYLYKEKHPLLCVLFPLFMVGMVALLLPAWLELTAASALQFLVFLACAGILFTGFAPAFKGCELESKVHKISAICAAIFSLLWVIFVSKMWALIIVWLVIVAVVAILTKTVKSSYVFWLETIAFLSTFTSVIGFYFI